jgi:hypothetical protein
MSQLTRARYMILIVALGLFISGITVWPALAELKLTVRMFWGDAAPSGELHSFVLKIINALEATNAQYSFMLYAHDWLAFAHVMLAILFAGAAKNPVRNKWVVQCGLIMCASVPILASICIPLRNLPGFWFWIDFAFAPGAAIPLLVALLDIRALERQAVAR